MYTTKKVVNQVTPQLLRSLIKSAELTAEHALKQVADSGSPETFAAYQVLIGEVSGYECLLKHMFDMTTREFNMAKKRGTL